MITGFRKLYFLYFLQRTSHDFENNRKMLPIETNQPLLCWKVSQPPHYAHKKSQPAPVLDFNNVSRQNYKSSKKPLLIVGASLKAVDYNERSYSIKL